MWSKYRTLIPGKAEPVLRASGVQVASFVWVCAWQRTHAGRALCALLSWFGNQDHTGRLPRGVHPHARILSACVCTMPHWAPLPERVVSSGERLLDLETAVLLQPARVCKNHLIAHARHGARGPQDTAPAASGCDSMRGTKLRAGSTGGPPVGHRRQEGPCRLFRHTLECGKAKSL